MNEQSKKAIFYGPSDYLVCFTHKPVQAGQFVTADDVIFALRSGHFTPPDQKQEALRRLREDFERRSKEGA